VSKRDFSKTETKSYQPQTFKQLCIRYNNLFQERNMDVVISILKKVHIKLKHYTNMPIKYVLLSANQGHDHTAGFW